MAKKVLSKRRVITLLLTGAVLFLLVGVFTYLIYAGTIQLGASGIIGKGSRGAALSKGATAPSKTWYFAEGTTRDKPEFDTFLCLQNPNNHVTKATVTFAYSTGGHKTKTYRLKKTSRFTVNVNAEVGQEKDIAMKVTSDSPIVAERAMYFIYQKKYGSHSSVGSPSLHTTWYFPEGCTGPGYDQWMMVYNPNSSNAKVTFKFQNASGASCGTKTISVPAGRRYTLKANDVAGSQWEVWTYVQSTEPIVAERSIYVHQGDKSGGTNSFGLSAQSSKTWYFGESYATSDNTFQEYISVIETSGAKPAKIKVTGYSNGKVLDGGNFDVPQLGRKTINVNGIAAFKDKTDLAISVQAISGSIMAERAEYIKHNFGRGVYVWDGTSETGVRADQLSQDWYLPEGYTTKLPGDKAFLEYLILFNPGNKATTVTMIFMKGNGSTVKKPVYIPAHSRETVEVNSIVTGEHSVHITSPQPITAEREIFYNSIYPPSITGINPTSGYAGTAATIIGSNFIDIKNVLMDGKPIPYKGGDANTLTATIPSSGSVGAHEIKVDTEKGTSNGVQFTIKEKPKEVVRREEDDGDVDIRNVVLPTDLTCANRYPNEYAAYINTYNDWKNEFARNGNGSWTTGSWISEPVINDPANHIVHKFMIQNEYRYLEDGTGQGRQWKGWCARKWKTPENPNPQYECGEAWLVSGPYTMPANSSLREKYNAYINASRVFNNLCGPVI